MKRPIGTTILEIERQPCSRRSSLNPMSKASTIARQAASSTSSPIPYIIDPVLDFDEQSGATATRSADMVLDYVHENGLTVEWILDTHPHADHFSAARYLSENTGAPTGIGEHVVRVQALWKQSTIGPPFQPTDRNGTGCSKMASGSGSANSMPR